MTDIQNLQAQIRIAEAEERKAAALESIVAQLPELIAALNKPRGGGWNRKPAEPKGTFQYLPEAVNYDKGDMVRVAVDMYNATDERVYFHHGSAKMGSVAYTSKTWERFFSKWTPNKDGAGHPIPARLLCLTLGQGDDGKKYWYVSGIEELTDSTVFNE